MQKERQTIGQKDVPTIEDQAKSDPRFQEKDEHPLGTRSYQAKEAEGKKTSGGVAVRKFTFSRSERLRRKGDFDRAYSEGKKVVTPALALFFCPTPPGDVPDGISRLGVSVSRKIGGAVVRNRIKRLLREAFRLNKHSLKKGYDILLVARAGIRDLKYAEVESLVLTLFQRGGLLVEEESHREDSAAP